MKKISLISCGIFLLALSGGLTSEATEYPVLGVTQGDIGFEASDKPPATPDPDPDPNPDDPEKPDPDPDPNPIGGALRFTHIPNISFGNNNVITSRTQNYYAKFEQREAENTASSHLYPTYFTVEDIRGGTKGWSVTISGDGIFTEENPSEKAKKIKTTLYFSNPSTKSLAELDPILYGPEMSNSEKEIAVTNDSSSSVRLATAIGEKEQGYGKWSVGYGSTSTVTTGKGIDGTSTEGSIDESKKGRNASVKLTVPNGQIINTKSLYTTTLTWELSDSI